MAERSEGPAQLGAAVALAAALGLFWAWNEGLGAAATGLLVAASAAGTLIGGAASRPLVRRLAPGRGATALAAAVALAWGILPALASPTAFVAERSATALAPFAAGAAVLAWLAGVLIGRLGALATAVVLASGLAWAVVRTPAEVTILPAPSAAPVEATDATAQRVAVFGIDSGDWRTLDPLLAAGELPNLRGLIERGASGVLRSAEPTYSPVVWSSIFTGKTPEKHGITGWFESHNANLRARPLWNLVESAGLESVVVNVPGTWPPRRIDGVLVSGFPIPALLTPPPDRPQEVVGVVIATAERPGSLVPTVVIPTQEGVAQGEVVMGEATLPRRTRLRNVAVEIALRARLLPPRVERVPVRIAPAAGGRTRVEIAGHTAELAPGEWSPWLRRDVHGQPVRFRVRALADGGFWVTPFYRDPLDPAHPIATDPERAARAIGEAMYVVEGAGWRMAGDRDLRDALAEHLRDIEEQHLAVTRSLAAQVPEWKLLVHVFTITDRSSHAFWRFQDPSAPPPGASPEEIAESRERLADAYRYVDARLGEALALVGPETTVLLASDHGSAATDDPRFGGHRTDGIWVAAGPGVRPSRERIELALYDVTPTVLSLLGLPPAADMDGVARTEVLAAEGEREAIASYEVEGGAPVTRVRVDTSTVDQLRSLGYVE